MPSAPEPAPARAEAADAPTAPGLLALLRESALAWSRDDCSLRGAALAYYTLFSLAPLLVIAIAIAALLYGEALASSELLGRLEKTLGADAADGVRAMIAGASRPRAGIAATVAGFAAMVVGASSAFAQLQRTLDEIFEVPAERANGWRAQLRQRGFALAMILATGLVLLLTLAVGTAVAALRDRLERLSPEAAVLIPTADLASGFALTALLFALLFRALPAAPPSWAAAWRGGLFTALLFALGRYAIAVYLGRSSAASLYGAASSLVVLLLWIYYSAQILFFGAEFTKVWDRRRGAHA